MGMANFGAYLGGMAQGQQQAEAQREHIQYLAMLQKKANDADADKQSTQDALFANNFSAGADPSVAPAPSPGTPSTSKQQMAMPGAQPLPPGAGGSAGPTAYAGTQPVPQGPPQPALQQPQAAPPQQLPQVQSPTPSAAPQAAPPQPYQPASPPAAQGAAPTDGFDQARQILAQANAVLQTPTAQKVLEDPQVKKSTDSYHAYIKELRDDGIDPTKPGGKKPDPVQMKRLQLLHDQLAVSMSEASKHITEDRKQQVQIGGKLADTYVKQQVAQMHMKDTETMVSGRVATAAARGAGGRAGSGPTVSMDSLGAEDKLVVQGYIDYAKAHNGKFPTGTGYNDPLKKVAVAEMQRNGDTAQGAVATNADNAADTRGLNIVGQKLAVLEPAYSAFEKNYDLVESVAKDYKLQGNQPLNSVVNTIRQKGGDAKAAAFEAAVRTVQTEYGKIMTGSTGAAGTSVAALKKAGDSINDNMTLSQLQAVRKVLETDGKNVLDGFRDQKKKLSEGMRTRGGKSAGGSGAGATPRGGSGAGATPRGGSKTVYLAPNGKTYTQDQINAAADATGEEPQAFAESRGLKIGQ